MTLDPIVLAHDLTLLRTASLFDLSTTDGRKASNTWLVELFERLVIGVRPKLVLELGAHEAAFSCAMRSALPKAQIHAFKVCVRKNGRDRPPTKGNNSLRGKGAGFEYEDVPVEMTTVDHFVEGRGVMGDSTVMWIDLEGCAYEALTGAERTLRSTSVILIEVEDAAHWEGQKFASDIHTLLFKAGFVAVARDFEYGAQYNVIFVSSAAYEKFEVRMALVSAYSAAGRVGAQSAAPA